MHLDSSPLDVMYILPTMFGRFESSGKINRHNDLCKMIALFVEES